MMRKSYFYLACLSTLLISSIGHADSVNNKEVYSYQSSSGTPIFTDKRPVATTQYNTQTIKAPNTSNSKQENKSYSMAESTQPIIINQTQTVVYSAKSTKKQHRKTKEKGSLKRCQRYKEKLDYYSEKMREGYKNSEYKNLEKNRKKYKSLLFNRCDTKTFKEY